MRTKGKVKMKQLEQQRRDEILSAAIKVFSRKGFYLATTDAIIKEAKIGKGTMYRYFKNKENLFLEIVLAGLDELDENIRMATDKIKDPIKNLEAAVHTYLLFFEKNPLFLDMIVHQQSEFKKKVSNRYFEHFHGNIDKIRTIFKNGIRKNLIKKNIDIDNCIWILTGMVNGLIFNWHADNKKFSLTQKASFLTETFFYGIMSDKKIRERA